jgi:cell division septum initiation protein DivIVA
LVRFRREKDGADDELRVVTAVAAPEPIDVQEALSGVTHQIEGITESAERKAAELRAEARRDAERMREEARAESERVLRESRAEAERRAQERERAVSATVAETRRAVERVNEAVAELHQRLDQVTDGLRAATVTLDASEAGIEVAAEPTADESASDEHRGAGAEEADGETPEAGSGTAKPVGAAVGRWTTTRLPAR